MPFVDITREEIPLWIQKSGKEFIDKIFEDAEYMYVHTDNIKSDTNINDMDDFSSFILTLYYFQINFYDFKDIIINYMKDNIKEVKKYVYKNDFNDLELLLEEELFGPHLSFRSEELSLEYDDIDDKRVLMPFGFNYNIIHRDIKLKFSYYDYIDADITQDPNIEHIYDILTVHRYMLYFIRNNKNILKEINDKYEKYKKLKNDRISREERKSKNDRFTEEERKEHMHLNNINFDYDYKYNILKFTLDSSVNVDVKDSIYLRFELNKDDKILYINIKGHNNSNLDINLNIENKYLRSVEIEIEKFIENLESEYLHELEKLFKDAKDDYDNMDENDENENDENEIINEENGEEEEN